jgi:hypothetical protein
MIEGTFMCRQLAFTALTLLLAGCSLAESGTRTVSPASDAGMDAAGATPPLDAAFASEDATAEESDVTSTSEDGSAADARTEPPEDAALHGPDAQTDGGLDATVNGPSGCTAGEADCRLECSPGALGACDLTCRDHEKCELTCSAGRTCNMTCEDADECEIACPTGALCNISCRNMEEGCDIECAPGSTCNIQCDNADCDQTKCVQEGLVGASCRLECGADDACDYPDCSGDFHCPEANVAFCNRLPLCPSG